MRRSTERRMWIHDSVSDTATEVAEPDGATNAEGLE
jgi:hypothetical protein